MGREVPGDQGSPARSPDGLAREWCRIIATTVYVPMSLPGIRSYLQDLIERLVAAGFTGEQSLSRTVTFLGRALPGAADNRAADLRCGRIVELLGALAAGYTWAMRDRVFTQQEEIKRALSSAWQDVERNLWASEARFREVFDSSPVSIWPPQCCSTPTRLPSTSPRWSTTSPTCTCSSSA